MNRYRHFHPRPRRRKRRIMNTSRRHVLVFSNVLLRSILLLLVSLHLCWSFQTAITIATLTTTTAIVATAAAKETVVALQQDELLTEEQEHDGQGPAQQSVNGKERKDALQQQVIDLVDNEESAASAVSVPSSDAGHIEYAYVPFPLWIIGIEVTLLIVSLLLCVGCWIFVYIFRNKMIVAIGQP